LRQCARRGDEHRHVRPQEQECGKVNGACERDRGRALRPGQIDSEVRGRRREQCQDNAGQRFRRGHRGRAISQPAEPEDDDAGEVHAGMGGHIGQPGAGRTSPCLRVESTRQNKAHAEITKAAQAQQSSCQPSLPGRLRNLL
jgi:hypothetical protein